MPGLLDDLSQGLQAAGGILSPEVYDQQQKQRQILQTMLFQAQMQKKNFAAQQITAGIQNGSVDPQKGQAALEQLGVNIPMGPSISAQLGQQQLQQYKDFQRWLEDKQSGSGISPGGLGASGLPMSLLGNPFVQNYIKAIRQAQSLPTGMRMDISKATPVSRQLYQQTGDWRVLDFSGAETAQSPIGKLGADLKAGRISQSEYDAAIAKATGQSGNSGFAKELADAGIKQGTPEWDSAWKKRLARETSPTMTMINMGGGQGSLSDPDTANTWYQIYYSTGKLPLISWGAAGNPTRKQFTEGFAKWLKDNNKTGADFAASLAKYKANAVALSALSKDLNTFEPYKTMLDTNANIAINLGKKITQTNSQLANRPLNWFRQNLTNNPDVAEYLAQMRIVQTEAARVINNPRIVGELTDQARRELDLVINGNAPIPVVERVLERLKNDGSNRFKAMRQQQTRLIKDMATPTQQSEASDSEWKIERVTQ